MDIETERLRVIASTREEVRAFVEAMDSEQRKELSADWLARLYCATPDPWILGFTIAVRHTGESVGTCGFKAPPDGDGAVEIAYSVSPEHQGRGYATEAADALVRYAFDTGEVRLVRAHTLPDNVASERVLTKCGFHRVGKIVDPDDGHVWRWERPSR